MTHETFMTLLVGLEGGYILGLIVAILISAIHDRA